MLKHLGNVKDEFDAAAVSQTPVRYQLTQDISMFVDTYKQPITISFKKSTIRINISPEEWSQRMTDIPQSTEAHGGSKCKRQCTTSVSKTVNMYGYCCDSMDHNPKWFYTREAAEKFGEQEGWDFTIVSMNVPAPDRNALVLQFLAYKTKAEILKRVTEDCYGCQYDRPSQTEHPCLEPWNDIVEEYYEKNAVKLSNILDDLNKLQNLLGLTYNFHDLTVKDEDMKNILKKSYYQEEFVSLFQEL